MGGFVYIVANKRHTVLYTGVTSDLEKRIWQHKNKQVEGFSKKYSCEKLVWFQQSDDIISAIEEEKRIKAGNRKSKDELISNLNPNWKDLSEDFLKTE